MQKWIVLHTMHRFIADKSYHVLGATVNKFAELLVLSNKPSIGDCTY